MNAARRRALAIAAGVKWLGITGAMLAPTVTEGREQWVLLAGAILFSVLRVDDRNPDQGIYATAGLLMIGSVAAGLDGGVRSLAFASVFVLAADAAAQRGGGMGSILGTLGTIVVLVVAQLQTPLLLLEVVDLWALLLTPLAGLAFGVIHRDLPITGAVALRATTQALDELVALSGRVQYGMDRWSVADAVSARLREQGRRHSTARPVEGPHLLLGIGGVLHGVGAPWGRRPVGLTSDLPSISRGRRLATIHRTSLPAAVGRELEPVHDRWLIHRFASEAGGGAVLVDDRTPKAIVDRVINVIGTSELALANSARFEKLQGLASDAARGRLAHDLHDSVAQSLTHARFELELLELRESGLADEVGRARAALEAALLDVRRTIGELEVQQTLSATLRTHVDTLNAFSRAELELEVESGIDDAMVSDDVAAEIANVAKEALSNAVRHSGCSRAVVRLIGRPAGIGLTVEDDGRGIGPDVVAGVGLTTMRERARTIGGDFSLEPRHDGGTRVALWVPMAGGTASDDGRGTVIGARRLRRER